MILLYAFSNQWGTNIARRVLSELQKIITHPDIIFHPVSSYPQEFFRKYIEYNNYSLIIGLGDGSKFSNIIRIETQAKNVFNDKEIYPFSPIYLDLNIPNVDIYESNNFKISSNMGTYNCNWLAFKTQLYLNQHSPDTKHLFLNLPQKANAGILANNIADLMKLNQMLQ